MKSSVLSGGCFELTDGWGLLFGCHLLIGGYCVGSFVYWLNGGYCVGSFVVCVLLLSGFWSAD